MKNNQNQQKGKGGDKSNQTPAQLGSKKEDGFQAVKKGSTKAVAADPEDMEEGTTLEEGKNKKTGTPIARKGNL